MRNKISLELFKKSIEVIRIQLAEDKKNAEIVAEVFGASTFNLYDNHKVIDMVIELLGIHFDIEEIRHYCFCLNFGKVSDEEDFESLEDFYTRLTRE